MLRLNCIHSAPVYQPPCAQQRASWCALHKRVESFGTCQYACRDRHRYPHIDADTYDDDQAEPAAPQATHDPAGDPCCE